MSKKKKGGGIRYEHGIPEAFLLRVKEMFGQSVFSEVEKTFVMRPTTLRINGIKSQKHQNTETQKHFVVDDVKEVLNNDGFKLQQVPWYKDAYILENKTKRELIDTEVYQKGEIYVQSLASMVPPLVLDPKPGEKVLDLTAAPGSKTSQMAAMMGQVGELVANDNNKIRFFKLKHNMEGLGVIDAHGPHPNPPLIGEGVRVPPPMRGRRSTEEERLGGGPDIDVWKFSLRLEEGWKICEEYGPYFDKILLDAPCSAEARFVTDNVKSYGYWKEHKIKEMAYKQRTLLFSAWSALKPGGTLVYSTCTFAPEENEMQISRLLERYPDEAEILPIDIAGLKTLQPLKEWKGKVFHPSVQKAIRLWPTKEVEGFFVAKLRKKTT